MPDAPTPLDLEAIRAILDRGVAATGGEWFHALRSCIDEVADLRRRLRGADRTVETLRNVLATRPAPTWDEDAVTDAAARAIYDAFRAAEAEDTPDVGYSSWDETSSHVRYVARSQAAAALAVVRDHQHVKPDREDIYRAWHGTDDPWAGCADSASIERVLDLWPGRSEAEVRADERAQIVDMLDADIDELEQELEDNPTSTGVMRSVRLINRRDRLAAEGGADRG